MYIFLIILSCLLWTASLYCLCNRQLLAPALSYLAMLSISFAEKNGWQLLPVNNTMLLSWLCMTLVIMFIVMLEPEPVRRQTKGTGYITVGAIAGMVVGLLGFTFSSQISLLYGIMALCTIAGIYLGFLMYTRTPEGAPVAPGSGRFMKYLLAKGFPAAITVIQGGVVLVLLIAEKTSLIHTAL